MINNLGFETDLIFLEKNKIVTNKGEYIVVKSPDNSHFFAGNFLLLNEPPEENKRVELENVFDLNFDIHSGFKHRTFCWRQPSSNTYDNFVQNGYILEELAVLVANIDCFKPADSINKEIEIKIIQSNRDWDLWVDFRRNERDQNLSLNNFDKYIAKRKELYEMLHLEGKGWFFGAFLGEELIGIAGLYFDNGIGRFQQVETKKAYRRKKVCTTLMNEICKIGFTKLNQLVIVADVNCHTIKLYRDLGFVEKECLYCLCLWSRD